jgi:AraC-like DNA-binding protein
MPFDRPPSPADRQLLISPEGLPGVLLDLGPAEPYRDYLHTTFVLLVVDGPFEVRRAGQRFAAEACEPFALHPDEAHSGWPLVASGRGSATPRVDGAPLGASGPNGERPEAFWEVLCLQSAVFTQAGVAVPVLADPVVREPRLARAIRDLMVLLRGEATVLEKEEAIAGVVRRLAASAGLRSRDARAPQAAQLAPAADLLHRVLDRNVTLAELADLAGTSTFALSRGFRRTYGLPAHALHLRLRLELAKDLLRRGGRPGDVAPATGFADQAHLTTVFRRTYGLTPGQFRARNAGTPSPR